ncbi:hypothetical protein GFL85_13785 [Rhizobium laguerreae]|uniref:P-loop NTPase fold protein n=1 Tax=Rhizobium laguerreae TaxID=1076926 RepID=UPI00143F6F02|nr:P-loop NTPase fold protein [Rhizobium laguerreae]NKM12090.1 hypothetical protein [Rhizobium laguerreae]
MAITGLLVCSRFNFYLSWLDSVFQRFIMRASMAKKSVERKILIDEPSGEDQFHGKGHERTADALARAITSFHGDDRAIGLDGPWGSGKSTVVEIARRKLAQEGARKSVSYNFFTFDIWQSQGSSFRRSFLEHFLDWTRATFPQKDPQLEDIERKVKGKVRQVQSNNQSMLDWWGIIVVLFIPFLPIYYFWAKSAFDAAEKAGTSFLYSAPFIVLILFIAATFIKALMRCWKELPAAERRGRAYYLARYREALSRTLLINAKQYEDQKVTQYIRETDPNDFEFQITLREILSVVQSEKSRVVLVLDNIDRLPKKEINEHWAQVRAVFSNGPLTKKSGDKNPVTAIVPYDRHLIEGGHKTKEGSNGNEGSQANQGRQHASISSLGTREIFSKTFDEILTVSPPVMSNSRDFFLEKIRGALPNVTESDDLFRVYLIFNRILKNENGNATPRQIIAFINELTGMYVLHQGRFSLPTVALYIAYQDDLESNPGILNERGCLDERLRALAADGDLERNLAAMIFNVEPKLAFQLLLDNKIKQAASADASDLLEIAKASGFDLRVNEVVQDNVDEWQNSGEFGTVVSNFTKLASQYEGDAKRHFSRTLVASFNEIRSVALDEVKYSCLFGAFDLASSDELVDLTKSILKAGFASLKELPLDVENGGRWMQFVGNLHRRLDSSGHSEVLANALSVVTLPNTPEFLFGVGGNVSDTGLKLAIFKPGKPDFSGDESIFETLAARHPLQARTAFSEFNSVSLLADEKWTSIGNALIDALDTDSIDGQELFQSYLDLLADVTIYIPSDKRSVIDTAQLFGNVQFYEKLQASVSHDNDTALGSAVFLAIQSYGLKGLPVPTKRAANGARVQDSSSEYLRFNGLFEGKEDLTADQYRRAASLAKAALVVTAWLDLGRSAPENRLMHGVIRSAFVSDNLPFTNLSLLMKSYEYLKILLAEDLLPMLDRYQVRVADKDIAAIKLEDCPVELVRDTFEVNGNRWLAFHERLGDLLKAIPVVDWSNYLAAGDHNARLLLEKIATSGFEFTDSNFRDTYAEFLLSVFAGRNSLIDTTLQYDLLLHAIDKNFHSDIFRKLREDLKDVNAVSLGVANQAFPRTVTQMVSAGDRLSKGEKDNVIRFVLCPALEGSNRLVLSIFENLGRTKVRDLIKQSQESTKEKLEGAWTVFSQAARDRSWARQVGELIHGKKKAKTLLDIFLGTGKVEEDEEEDA